MQTYHVMWTYIGNYGGPYKREADSPEGAARSVIRGFSDDFGAKAKLYVFDSPPSFTLDCRTGGSCDS